MTCDDLRLLIDYHYWARDRVLDALAVVPISMESARLYAIVLAHLNIAPERTEARQ
jgi:hypothetical protein